MGTSQYHRSQDHSITSCAEAVRKGRELLQEVESEQIQKVLASPPLVMSHRPGYGTIRWHGAACTMHSPGTQNCSSCPCRALSHRGDLLLSGSPSVPLCSSQPLLLPTSGSEVLLTQTSAGQLATATLESQSLQEKLT